ncbi:TetR family transcriptional regulator [Conexibacter sp. W3-3-2]|uniref:TetR family transcriptional regulator n=1 Tax=Paraconexibacter algicola TaxID=2133960 RepID=A0A2T4UJD0_9ACTN|nr:MULTISPECIES: TetR/AcrR family transcriptional regulator [Solirubrobacterales]MTD45647.1 TetR family transcriptional regulator [Conexibacter sp. W3-3-2]PTL59315.1 TetR family transcriptional regulator [Paraconexibacter algicola]
MPPSPLDDPRRAVQRSGKAAVKAVRRATGTTPPARPRRTQEQRTAETRAKLLDATIESLLEAGYAATTTRRVAELAGVSQGAQTHHFPYRVDLVTAAVERLTEQRISDLGERLTAIGDDADGQAGALLDLLWGDFSSDIFTVFVKVWVAAADDPELHERLVPLERMMARSVASLSSNLLTDGLRDADMEGRLLTVLATMRGLALTERFEPRGRKTRDPWPLIRPVLVAVVRGGD